MAPRKPRNQTSVGCRRAIHKRTIMSDPRSRSCKFVDHSPHSRRTLVVGTSSSRIEWIRRRRMELNPELNPELKAETGARIGVITSRDDSKAASTSTSRRVVVKSEKIQHPVELVNELTDAFTFFDLNGDGKLTVQEMAKVVRSLSAVNSAEGDLRDDLVKLIGSVDADGDGCLDLREFIDLNTRTVTLNGARLDDGLATAFDKWDEDHDGFVSAEELHKVLGAFGAEAYSLEECRGMISGADENGDRLMSLREFQASPMSERSIDKRDGN